MEMSAIKTTNHLIAIESAGDVCSVAAFVGARHLKTLESDQPRAHAEMLVSLIETLLSEYLSGHVDVIAVSSGPGSFTGLRIGASTAKGLAFARDAKIVAVPTLLAAAASALYGSNEGTRIILASPSRKGELYFGAFENSGLVVPQRILADSATDFDEFEKIVTTSGLENIDVAVTGKITGLQERLTNMGLSGSSEVKPTATEVGMCALPKIDLAEFEDTSAFEPYYLKPFHARKPKLSPLERLPF